MKSRDDLLSVLELGWQVARTAWRMFRRSDGQPFDIAQIGSTGRDLDQLAFDLRRLDQDKPARLAYSLGFILNGLVDKTITFDDELAEQASQITVVLSEMLLELESSSEVMTPEPADLAEFLKARCGLMLYSDERSNLPSPHFQHMKDESPRPVVQLFRKIVPLAFYMASSSERLMQKVLQLGDFPYTSTLSRIHHLAIELNDEIRRHQTDFMDHESLNLQTPSTGISVDLTGDQPEELLSVAPAVQEPEIPTVSIGSPGLSNLLDDQTPHVLVIDESPFFRMLLTSAIESCGYSIHVVSRLEEAMAACRDVHSHVVIQGCSDPSQDIEPLRAWLSTTTSHDTRIIALTSSDTVDDIDGCDVIQRTNISGLLSLVTQILGVAPKRERRIA